MIEKQERTVQRTISFSLTPAEAEVLDSVLLEFIHPKLGGMGSGGRAMVTEIGDNRCENFRRILSNHQIKRVENEKESQRRSRIKTQEKEATSRKLTSWKETTNELVEVVPHEVIASLQDVVNKLATLQTA